MVIFDNKVYGLADNIQFKKANRRKKRVKYILFVDKRAYPINGVSAKLLESIIHLNSFEFSDISKFKKTIKSSFLYFLESNWIQEKTEEKNRTYVMSIYTYCTIVNKKYYIMNFIYKTVDRITKEAYDYIMNNEYDKLPFSELFYLYTRKYIQNEHSINEINNFENQIDNKIVYLVLSYNCNLRCTYCFERSKSRSLEMSNEVLSDTLKFIDSLSIGKSVVINFYGGEPLLEKNRDNLNTVINRFKNNKNIYFRFITNGVYINDYIETFNLVRNKIISFVITIDGTKVIHDSRRITKELKGSFDSIIKSIGTLNKYSYPVIIRINIDNENLDCQEELIRYFNKTIKNKSKVKIEYHKVEDKTNLDYNPVSYLDCYKLYNKIKKISKFGVTFNLPIINILNAINNKNTVPQIKKSYCTLDSNYVIDYDGQIYSCNEAMGNEDFKIGIVGQDAQIEYQNNAVDANCRSCPFYIACYGGCCLEKNYYRKCNRNKCDYEQIKDAINYFLANEARFIN